MSLSIEIFKQHLQIQQGKQAGKSFYYFHCYIYILKKNVLQLSMYQGTLARRAPIQYNLGAGPIAFIKYEFLRCQGQIIFRTVLGICFFNHSTIGKLSCDEVIGDHIRKGRRYRCKGSTLVRAIPFKRSTLKGGVVNSNHS